MTTTTIRRGAALAALAATLGCVGVTMATHDASAAYKDQTPRPGVAQPAAGRLAVTPAGGRLQDGRLSVVQGRLRGRL